MSGHSKWSTIKHKKGLADIQKGKVFSQLSKNIRLAVKEGRSGDPQFNPALRTALEKARMSNMPKENIQRAIDRGLGKGKGGQLQEVVYEAFAPHGVPLVIVAHTENHQRTAGEIRSILSKAGGSLGGPGSVMYLFEHSHDEYTPTMPIPIDDPEQQESLQTLIDTLRSNEDVEDVYTAGVWSESESELE